MNEVLNQALLDKLRSDINSLKCTLEFYNHVRDIATNKVTEESTYRDELNKIFTEYPPLVDWKILDHCAGITRLYALFERFIEDVIENWLARLPLLFNNYYQLPERVRIQHRVGSATILSKLGGPQFGGITETQIIAALSSSVIGVIPYELVHKAFLMHETNLWPETITELFGRIGIEAAWGWAVNSNSIIKFMENTRGGESTPDSELGTILRYRNAAAHGSVDDLISLDEFIKFCDFIILICESLDELLYKTYIERSMEIGHATLVGTVIHKFSNNVIGANFLPIRLVVGDELVFLRDTSCFPSIIESMEVERKHLEETIPQYDQPVGLKLGRPVPEGTLIVRMHSKPLLMALEALSL